MPTKAGGFTEEDQTALTRHGSAVIADLELQVAAYIRKQDRAQGATQEEKTQGRMFHDVADRSRRTLLKPSGKSMAYPGVDNPVHWNTKCT